MNLFVSNISHVVGENALQALFSEFGEVNSVKIINDKQTGQSKGFGFVEMLNDHEAFIAIEKLSRASFFGKSLIVSKARPKS